MTASPLPAALRAGAGGLYAIEAATGLIIAHGTWLARDDFTHFIHHGTGTAAIDWESPSARWTPAVSLAQAGNDECSALPPASPTTSRSASARPLPASTTTTLAC
jgi:hypothetical protein